MGWRKGVGVGKGKGGITVNAICPGYINTEMVQAVPKEVLEKSILPLIPVNRLGEPDEIARAVVFLAADEAGAITGSPPSLNRGAYMFFGVSLISRGRIASTTHPPSCFICGCRLG